MTTSASVGSSIVNEVVVAGGAAWPLDPVWSP